MTGLMTGKRGLIMGLANDKSLAWGIAKALLGLAVDWLFGLGYARIHLSTGANTRADRFYAAQGWRRDSAGATEIAYSLTKPA